MKIFSIVAVYLFTALSVMAGEVDFSTIITDADGAPIIDCTTDCGGKPPLTLGRVSMRALTAIYNDEPSLSGEDKFRRGELAMRVYKGGSVALTAEDTALLKRLIAKGYGPLIVLKTWPLLDPVAGK